MESGFMSYLSSKTREIVNIVGEVANTLDFDIGNCLAKKSNGDMAWFILTDAEPGIENMFILICTPHTIMAEYNWEEDRGFSLVTNVGELLEHLQCLGYRRLTEEEMDFFTGEL